MLSCMNVVMTLPSLLFRRCRDDGPMGGTEAAPVPPEAETLLPRRKGQGM